MEAFMRNLPEDLNEKGLGKQLRPLMADLRIKDWHCQKISKKNFGNIAFLDAADGEKFLRQHGERPIPGVFDMKGRQRTRSHLYIMGFNVYCKKSNTVPDTFLLKSMTKTAEDRDETEQNRQAGPADSKVIFTTQALECGFYDYDNVNLIYCPELHWGASGGTATFLKDSVIVKFRNQCGSFKVEIPYRTVEAIVFSPAPFTISLTLLEVPRFYEVVENDLTNTMAKLNIQNGQKKSGMPPAQVRLTELPTEGIVRHSDVINQALIYRISIQPDDLHQKMNKIRAHGVLSPIYHHFSPSPFMPRTLFDGRQHFNEVLRECAKVLPFDILFQFEVLVQNGYLPPWTVAMLVQHLAKYSRQSTTNARKFPISAEAVKSMLAEIPFPGPGMDASIFSLVEIWEWLVAKENELRNGLSAKLISERARANLTTIYKASITPTGMTLHGPEYEAKNRILRRFEEYTDYFVRVQFCDEDGRDIFFNARVSHESIDNRFKKILNTGIQIGGRLYSFLGFSHSSLRSHAAWFMAPFVHNGELQTYFTVRDYIGKFDNIHCPARCAARIGQAFSETPFAVSLRDNDIKNYLIPDIEMGKRVFTDGVGKISPEVVDIINQSLPKSKHATCFQIRWAGAKGMLALDTSLEGKAMVLRPSMIKFGGSDQTNLEICDVANKPIPLVLNRQMIKILEDLAVPETWFFDQQNRELDRIKLITAQSYNTVSFLKRQKIAEKIGLSHMLRRLDRLGIDFKHDNFLCGVIEATILRELRLLKHKARIPVEGGVSLFGICDETGFLEDDQVFVTFDQTEFQDAHYLDLHDCELLVTRSPALHPGDIQMAHNVIPPEDHPLRYLSNCIVFSQKGMRDLPSQLSGGDLDGDTYQIIWDPEAVDSSKRVFDPADYPRVEPMNIGREVTKEDMTDFFVHFMSTDQLGVIATRHLILADQRYAGTVDDDCKKLAHLHSTGVDYSKTGLPVDISELRTIKTNRYRPDFLAPAPPANLKDRSEIVFDAPINEEYDDEDGEDYSTPRHIFYKSDRVLGKLFRAVDEKKIWSEQVTIKRITERKRDVWGELLEFVLEECIKHFHFLNYKEYEKAAWDIRHAYEDAIWKITVDYADQARQPISEIEVFTGNILNKAGVQTRRQRDRSMQLKDEYDRISQWITGLINNPRNSSNGNNKERNTGHGGSVHSSANGSDSDEVDDDTDPLAPLAMSIACLVVSLHKDKVQRGWGTGNRSDDEYYSFRAVAACCTIKEMDLAIRKMGAGNNAITTGGGCVGVSTGWPH